MNEYQKKKQVKEFVNTLNQAIEFTNNIKQFAKDNHASTREVILNSNLPIGLKISSIRLINAVEYRQELKKRLWEDKVNE
ncbi:hypothetical protein C0966_04450 [Bacillus methanolicus]|uniref:hypothetical protein n=1 Tax=Bacillus methanolicus TaxID=1471 RepID=UPI00237FDBE8|nr:hypothetical protein [Bacillus methanolicus]MDE3838639.1 hypothetical protein [Bacillus methanolicus]